MTTYGKNTISAKSGLKTRTTKNRYWATLIQDIEKKLGLQVLSFELKSKAYKPETIGKGKVFRFYSNGMAVIESRNTEECLSIWFHINCVPIIKIVSLKHDKALACDLFQVFENTLDNLASFEKIAQEKLNILNKLDLASIMQYAKDVTKTGNYSAKIEIDTKDFISAWKSVTYNLTNVSRWRKMFEVVSNIVNLE